VPSFDSEFLSYITLAWSRQLDVSQLIDFAGRLNKNKQHTLEAILYQSWLVRNNTPLNYAIYFNLGTTLSCTDDLDGAKEAYLQSIKLDPSFIQPHFNLGIIYERLNQTDLAISEWLWVVNNHGILKDDLRSLRLLALNNLGRIYESKRQYSEALFYLTQSLDVEPNQPDTIHHWIFLRARLCEWPIYAPIKGISQELFHQSTSALAMISLSDDPESQLAAAKHFVEKKLPAVQALSIPKSYKHSKIRIGYLSSDICLHPVAMLTAELFELHDKNNFEIYAYCWSREDGSAIRQRIIESVDHFKRISDLTDIAAAALIKDDEIDILIDLHGQTLGARPCILAYRPALIQITYLGLPATTGFPFIDYVITDKFLTPEKYTQFYTEKPLYMPDIYQVSDRQRVVAPIPSRESCGLPEDSFVFCAFNNNHKYTPEIFSVWMNILKQVPNSVIWLLAEIPQVETNLRKEAARLGIDASRLVFAKRVLPDMYYARYGVADLFLDTYPFNGGTTANDALWMELPVLTYTGRTFASRMAGALLTAADLEELITYNLSDYEEKAVFLANSPEECQRLRHHLKQVKAHGKLFDTPRFVQNLEEQFKQLIRALD
jgi:predicted O-linked N-acetylglucosamine transferase (SPINDLY family)